MPSLLLTTLVWPGGKVQLNFYWPISQKQTILPTIEKNIRKATLLIGIPIAETFEVLNDYFHSIVT